MDDQEGPDAYDKIPEDFPGFCSHASLSGAQPKLSLIEVEGRFVQSASDQGELRTHYRWCEQLAGQVAAGCRKNFECGRGDTEAILLAGLNFLRTKSLCPDRYNVWVMRRAAILNGWAPLNVQPNSPISIEVDRLPERYTRTSPPGAVRALTRVEELKRRHSHVDD